MRAGDWVRLHHSPPGQGARAVDGKKVRTPSEKSEPGAPRPARKDSDRDRFAFTFEQRLRDRAARLYQSAAVVEGEIDAAPRLPGDSRTYLDKLVALYFREVDERIARAAPERMLDTLQFHVDRRTSPQQLQHHLDTARAREWKQIMAQTFLIYLHGFGLAGIYAMSVASGPGHPLSHDKQMNAFAHWAMQCLLVGLGGTFGALATHRVGLGEKYFKLVGFDADGKTVRYLKTGEGWRADLLTFLGFSVGHTLVDTLADPNDKLAHAQWRMLSAVLSTGVAMAVKGLVLPRLAVQDPVLLNVQSARDRKAVEEHIQALSGPWRESACRGDLPMKWFGLGVPAARTVARGLLHVMAAMVVLAFYGAAGLSSDERQKFGLMVAGSVLLGPLWGVMYKAASETVLAIEEAAIAKDRSERLLGLPSSSHAAAASTQAVHQVTPPRSGSIVDESTFLDRQPSALNGQHPAAPHR